MRLELLTRDQLVRVVRAQTARLEYLEGVALGVALLPDALPDCLAPLGRQSRALLGLLAATKGRAVETDVLARDLPAYDHAEGRDPATIRALVFLIRKRLGQSCIETVEGGYRLSDVLRAQLSPTPQAQ